jgi:galactose mutarotase-like enzyme
MAAHEIHERRDEGYTVVSLRAPAAGVEADFVPDLSMLGCSLRLGGAELLHQAGGLAAYAATRQLRGIPILHPWANRLGGNSWAAAGPPVTLSPADPALVRDRNGLPIHGLLVGATPWQEIERHADADEARLTARFTFAAGGALTARFPFPHEIDLSVRLRGASLQFDTTLRATGSLPVPIAFGFHPYFRLPDEARARWLVALPVRRRLVLDERMIPTGHEQGCAFPLAPLGSRTFDDGFAGIDAGARFVLQGKRTRIAVSFDRGFPYAQVYAPLDRDFICFEPMTAPANALASGDGLQCVPAGGEFRATWTIHLEHI